MAGLASTTVRIKCPLGWKEAMAEFEAYGEIARFDVTLATTTGVMLVAFFDSRAVAQILLDMPGRAELSPGQLHDFRAVKVSMKAIGEKLDSVGSFSAFGEVANCSVEDGDVVVEFFDMRAAQSLLGIVGASGSPWTAVPQELEPQARAPSLPAVLQGPRLQAATSKVPTQPMAASQSPDALADSGFNFNIEALTQALQEVTKLAQASSTLPKDSSQIPGEDFSAALPNNTKMLGTKVTQKDFSKYDIDPAKIQSCEDQRTTVMVRNLTGANARKDFLNFLAICGLSDRYTFFYMPYKEHCDVLAGYAFVNLVAPGDVQVLHAMMKHFSHKVYRSANAKPPVVSYARFQGHKQLVKHFSSSAVLHELDPEKRPIFRPFAGKGREDSKLNKAEQEAGLVAEHIGDEPIYLPMPQMSLGMENSVISDMLPHSKLGFDSVEDHLSGPAAGA
jgi:hypothetical protein